MCKCQSCNDKCQGKYIDAKCIKTKYLKAKKATICEDLNVKGDVTIDGDLTFNNGLQPVGKLGISLSLSKPEFTILSDFSSTSSSWDLSSTPASIGPIIDCPLDDLVEQTIPEGNSLLIGTTDLQVTNVNGDGTESGPWRVKNVQGSNVILCGISEEFSPGSSGNDEPAKDSTISNITINNISVDTSIEKIIDIEYGVSTETDFDFLNIFKNGDLLLSVSGFNNDALQPYLFGTLTDVLISVNDEIKVQYFKDSNFYQGVDLIYFNIKNVRSSKVQAFEPTISVCRGNDIIYTLSACTLSGETLNEISSTGLIQESVNLLVGDIIKLTVDNDSYASFTASGCFFDKEFLLRHREEEEYTQKLTLNDVAYDYIMPSPKNRIGGWYEANSGFLAWIQDFGDEVRLNLFQSLISGPFYINTNANQIIVTLECLGQNKYSLNFAPGLTGIYVFDPKTGKIAVDLNDESTLKTSISLNVFTDFTPILNPDERLWKYEHRLTDESAIFNSFESFLDFTYNFYKMGYGSSWTSRSKQLEGSVNPSDKDLTQIARTIGGLKVNQYEDLYTTLKQTGISYEYNVKKAVYWPYPGTITDQPLKESVRYPINQNRYNFLAFILDFPQLSETNWPKLLPGERVQLSGTGVARLEDQPLRLATSGYSAGPLPPNTHAPQYSIDNWSYYTFRLPIIITESNNIIRSRYSNPNIGLTTTVIPVGTYYFGEILDLLASQSLIDMPLLTVGRYAATQLDSAFGVSLDEAFGEGTTNALANRQSLSIVSITGIGLGDLILYGPTHPDFPSTFFNTEGIDIGDKFPPNQEIVVADGGFDLVDVLVLPINEYKPHTPLTEGELTTLVSNIGNITLSATHGPIRNNMDVDNMVACVFELSQAHSTENHQLIFPWSKKCEGGLDELFLDQDDLISRLNSIEVPEFPSPAPPVSDPFNQTVSGIRSLPLRILGQGDFSERSELYRAGGREFSRTIQNQSRGYNVLTWQPQRRENFYYPTPTVLPGFGDVSGRETETVVSYLKEAFWMTVTAASPNDPPVYDMAAYETNSSAWTSMFDNSDAPSNPDAVAGNWMVGIYEDSVVQRAFGEAVPNPLPVYGYLTHDATRFSTAGDVEQLPWYDPDFELVNSFGSISAAVAMVSKIFQYFNANGVSHFVMDQRTTVGGGAPVAQAISILSGGDRQFNINSNLVESYTRVNPNGVSDVFDRDGQFLYGENEGTLTYPVLGLSSKNDCKPSAYLANGVPVDGFFQGTPESPKRIIWINPNSTISATQQDLAVIKGTSLDKDTFDGDLGNDTCVAVYGTYSLPFSTGGGYISTYSWYGVGRSGEEELRNPPMNGIDRFEVSRSAYTTNDNVLQALDQSFNQLIRPHILWDMNSNVWFQDIGFVNGGVNVQPAVDGEPWVDQRPAISSPVDYDDVSTWRDAAIDRSFIMANDPNLKDNFYAQNSYGFISDPSP